MLEAIYSSKRFFKEDCRDVTTFNIFEESLEDEALLIIEYAGESDLISVIGAATSTWQDDPFESYSDDDQGDCYDGVPEDRETAMRQEDPFYGERIPYSVRTSDTDLYNKWIKSLQPLFRRGKIPKKGPGTFSEETYHIK